MDFGQQRHANIQTQSCVSEGPKVIRAVFDCNVIIAALGWRGNSRFCLDLVYAGQVLQTHLRRLGLPWGLAVNFGKRSIRHNLLLPITENHPQISRKSLIDVD